MNFFNSSFLPYPKPKLPGSQLKDGNPKVNYQTQIADFHGFVEKTFFKYHHLIVLKTS